MASVYDAIAVWSLDEIDRREGMTIAVSERDPLPAPSHDFRCASLSPEPANGPGNRMRPPGATEVGLRVEDRHPGGVSGERPEHFAMRHNRRRTSCHPVSAYSDPLLFPRSP